MTLKLQSVTACYRNRSVFTGLTLPEIPAGALVAVVGPNAVGKSTLLKSIAGLLPIAGTMTFAGENLADRKSVV